MSKNSQKTRLRILRAAAEIFADRGYRAATVRQICARANANIAAINYHFDSKENLYYETFKFVFQDAGALYLPSKPPAVKNAAEWRAALLVWTRLLLDQATSPQKMRVWENKLYARERLDPSRVLPVLMEEFLLPVTDHLEYLLRMGLPGDTPPAILRMWVLAVTTQCTMYGQREKPWDALFFPTEMPREEWLEMAANFVVDGICARLKFRGGSAAAAPEKE